MKKEKCFICKKVSGVTDFGHFICPDCKPVQHIVCTSADDGVKFGIPGASLDVLRRAMAFENKSGRRRATILTALWRAIRKLERKEKTK